MKRRGYIFTISIAFLMAAVLLLASFFATRVETLDISPQKLAMSFDDIESDIADLMGISGEYKAVGNSSRIIVRYNASSFDTASDVNNYVHYTESKNASIFRASNASFINEGWDFDIIPYNFTGNFLTPDKTYLILYPRTIEGYEALEHESLHLNLAGAPTNITENIVGGDMNFSLALEWPGGSFYRNNINISITEESNWTFTGSMNVLTIRVGEVEGKYGALGVYIPCEDCAEVEITLQFDNPAPAGAISDFRLNLSDIAGKTSIERDIWFIKD